MSVLRVRFTSSAASTSSADRVATQRTLEAAGLQITSTWDWFELSGSTASLVRLFNSLGEAGAVYQSFRNQGTALPALALDLRFLNRGSLKEALHLVGVSRFPLKDLTLPVPSLGDWFRLSAHLWSASELCRLCLCDYHRSSNMDTEFALSLHALLTQHPSLHQLDLECFDLTRRAWQVLSGTPLGKVAVLKMSGTRLGQANLTLTPLLGPVLRELALSGAQLDVLMLKNLFFHNLGYLKVLDLSRNPLRDEGVCYLARVLCKSRLSHLLLHSTFCTVIGARALGAALSNSSLVSLDLGKNRIGDMGAAAIVQGITRGSKSSLLALSLEQCDIASVCDILGTVLSMTRLTSLNMSGNGIGLHHNLTALPRTLQEFTPCIQELNLSDLEIDDFAPLALCASRCHRLTTLILRHTSAVGAPNLVQLVKVATHHRSLIHVDLQGVVMHREVDHAIQEARFLNLKLRVFYTQALKPNM